MSTRIEITDMCTHPYITSRAPYTWNAEGTQRDDGLWQYEVKDKTGYVRSTGWSVGANSGASYCMRGCEWIRGGTISPTVGWNACRVVDTAFSNHEFVVHVDAEPVTLLAYAVYSATDWPHIEQQIITGELPAGWFAPPMDTPAGVKTTPRLIP